MSTHQRLMYLLLGFFFTGAYVLLAVWTWGDPRAFFQHPARSLAVLMLFALTAAVALAAGGGPQNVRREDMGNRWVIVPLLLLGLLLAWLPPYGDRRELWTLDGDLARYAGLGLLIIGGVLRVLPMFILGHRFSGLVAIQEGHELVTGGIYRLIRHPSYLGGLLLLAGWSLVFRSGMGLLLIPAVAVLLHSRIESEEALLESEFGEGYRRYREKTWRLLPYVY